MGEADKQQVASHGATSTDAARQRATLTPDLRATAGTALTSFFLQGVLVISGVLAARFLGVTGRGELAFLWIVALIIAQLGTLGVPTAVTYFIASGWSTGRGILQVTAKLLALQCIALTCIQAGVLWAFLHTGRPQVIEASGVTLLTMPALMLNQYGLAVLQGRHQFRLYNLQRAIPLVLYALGLLVVVVVGHGKLLLVTSVWSGSIIIGGVATFVVARSASDRPIHPRRGTPQVTLPKAMRFGIRAMFGVFSGLEQLNLDQAIVGLILSTHALGFYVVALAFSNLPLFVGQSVGYVAFPAVAACRSRRDMQRALRRFLTIGFAACSAVVLGIVLVVPFVLPALFGQSFRPAVTVAEILLIGALFQSLRRVVTEVGRGAGYPLLGTVAELGSWLLMAPAIAILAPSDGLQGVAWAFGIGSAASFFIAAVGLAVLVRRSEPPAPRGARLIVPALVRQPDPLIPE